MIVVLVDDDIDDLQVFCDAVLAVDKSIECICFLKCEDFNAYLSTTEHIPDYIFCDLVMPTITGIDCMREVRSYGKFNNTKLVAYSTSLPDKRLELIETFNATFLFKPHSFDGLVDEIKNIFEVQQL
jgi:DNA-binding NtrC family response regulator